MDGSPTINKFTWKDRPRYEWRISSQDSLLIDIIDTESDTIIATFFIGAIMEMAGRTAILDYCMTLENSPWVESWHDTERLKTMNILKR